MNDAEIKLQVKLDSSTAEQSITNLSKKTEDLSKKFTSAGKTLTVGLTLPIVAFGVNAIKAASDLGETMNKIDVAFGDSSDSVKSWAKTSIKQFGMAQQTALDMSALFGDMATGMGVNQKEAAKLGTNLTGLAGDLASFKNISLDVAKTALAGVFTGETESLKQLGIIMTQTNLEQYALSKGITKGMDKMTEAEKIQLRYSFVVDRSKNAVGDFAKTSKSTANQVRTTGETFKEMSASLGEQLLPIVNIVLGKIQQMLLWFTNLDKGQKNMILTIMAVAAALGPLLLLISSILKGIVLWDAAMKILAANPIILTMGLVVLSIAAVAAAIYQIVKNWETVKLVLNAMWTTFKNVFGAIGTFVTGIFKGIVNGTRSMANSVIGFLNSMISGFLTPFNVIIKALNKLPGVNIKLLSYSIPKMPMLNVGTNYVAGDGLAYLHQGEAVVPKKYNPAIGGGSGGMLSLNISMGNIEMDGRQVGKAVTPYVTRVVKLGGGNV